MNCYSTNPCKRLTYFFIQANDIGLENGSLANTNYQRISFLANHHCSRFHRRILPRNTILQSNLVREIESLCLLLMSNAMHLWSAISFRCSTRPRGFIKKIIAKTTHRTLVKNWSFTVLWKLSRQDGLNSFGNERGQVSTFVDFAASWIWFAARKSLRRFWGLSKQAMPMLELAFKNDNLDAAAFGHLLAT